MKRILIIAVAALIGLASCSKVSPLIGSWKLDSVKTIIEGQTIEQTAAELELEMILTFSEGGKYTVTEDGYTDEGNWEVVDNKLYVDDVINGAEFSVSGKKLSLTMTRQEEGVEITTTMNFNKI